MWERNVISAWISRAIDVLLRLRHMVELCAEMDMREHGEAPDSPGRVAQVVRARP